MSYLRNEVYTGWFQYGSSIIYTDGKVGIGTNNPLSTLDVRGNITTSTILPYGDAVVGIGTAGARYTGVYSQNFYGSGASLTNLPLNQFSGLTQYAPLYASATTTVASVASTGTTGQALLSGGAAAPAYGALALAGASTVSGTLPVANGGTGVTTSTGSGSVVLSSGPTFSGTVNFASIVTFSGSTSTNNGINFSTNGSGITWGVNYSRIYDDSHLRITTDDNMYITAPGLLNVSTPSSTFTGTVASTGFNSLINLYNATAQTLNVGQTAYYDTGTTSVTSIALNINCGDNQIYDIWVIHKGTTAYAINYDTAIYPNNTSYASQFNYVGVTCSAGVAFVNNYFSGSMPYFWFDDINGSVYPPYMHRIFVHTGSSSSYPIAFNLSAGGGGTNSSYVGYNYTAAVWNQTSTRWTSLGTITTTGGASSPEQILVTRLY